MKLWKLILLFGVIIFKETFSISVECEFEDDQIFGGKYGYQCLVKSINATSKNDREITEITGKHIEGRSNCDVVQFDLRVGNLGRFPLGIKKYFPNIETLLLITNTDLKEVSAEDLKPFGEDLRFILLGQNSIEIIDFDLFRYNPNLELISFYANPIRHIDDGAFDNLPKLQTLIMNKISCAGDTATNEDRLSTLKLIRTAETNCKDPSIAKEREEIQKLKYEIQKTQGLLGFELESRVSEKQWFLQNSCFTVFRFSKTAVNSCFYCFSRIFMKIVEIRQIFFEIFKDLLKTILINIFLK